MYPISLIAILLLNIFGLCQVQANTTWIIQKGISLKKAIAQTKDGDTIIVKKGFYQEGNMVINKSIVLLGEDYPILDGENKHEIFTITVPHVIIKGFKLQNCGNSSLNDLAAIKVLNTHHVQIIDNQLKNNFFGIYLSYVQNSLVKGNKVISNATTELHSGNGIHCWKSDSLQIIGNAIEGHRDGIYFEFVTHSIIWRNTAFKNVRYGLHFMFSNDDAYITNHFKNNGAGVAVMFTKNVKMFNNFFEENWGDAAYGLLLKEISDSYLLGNFFRKNTSGIYMEGTNRIKVKRNVFRNNGWAMQIQASCMENIIQENNFLGNSFDVSTNGSVVLNTFLKNYWDKYEGYDLNKDAIGDVPYRPLSLFSIMVEKNNSSMLLYRSFMVTLLDKSEKILPSITPDNFIDNQPLMKPLPL